jgi:hypothetical protein
MQPTPSQLVGYTQLTYFQHNNLLAHAGLAVVEEMRTGHDSMVYGLSWMAPFSAGTEAEPLTSCEATAQVTALASCSFYDSSLNVWQPRAVGRLASHQQ